VNLFEIIKSMCYKPAITAILDVDVVEHVRGVFGGIVLLEHFWYFGV